MTTTPKATLLIAHEYALVRAAIRAAFDAEPDLKVVAEAGKDDDAVVRTRCHRPDIVLVSETFPGPSGGVCAKLVTSVPWTKVVVIGDVPTHEALQAAIEAGAAG
jgi:DNA-binding NarL/FixJ family response regulator